MSERTTASSSTEDEIKAEIFRVVSEAEAEGRDSRQAFQAAFPGAPDGPYWEAWCDLDDAKEKAWYEAMIRTIDGDAIRRASQKIASPDKGNPPA